jgi:hypothetical protein
MRGWAFRSGALCCKRVQESIRKQLQVVKSYALPQARRCNEIEDAQAGKYEEAGRL